MGLRRSFVAALMLAGAIALAACSGDTSPPGTTAPILSTTTATATTTTEAPSTTTEPPSGSTTTQPPPPTTTTSTVPLADLDVRLVTVADGFDAPVLLVADPAGAADLVVEQPGRIVRVDDGTAVLDIRDDVVYGGERGLLGLAFHPDFATTPLAFVNYTGASGQTVIEQFVVDGSGTFDTASRFVVLEVPQPASNHNGGMIAFGPDGYLWIGMGDGGGANDRFGQGQRADTLLGAMLRIAVGIDGVDRYAIPPDNPHVDGSTGAPEVWATGLRNPWRFTFDDGAVWIADVGQNELEEVSVAPASDAGLNYGWPIMEGTECFRSASCDQTALVLPVTEYGHGEGCSITGGHVYRGEAIPELTGQYFYSDFCSGFLRSFSVEDGDIDWTAQTGSIPSVSGFGVGGDGELYVVSLSGSIHRLERAA